MNLLWSFSFPLNPGVLYQANMPIEGFLCSEGAPCGGSWSRCGSPSSSVCEPHGHDRLGVVLIHGKIGVPSVFQGLAATLEQEGILATSSGMPWSRSRYLDATLEEAMDEIAASVQSLRQKGANRIAVGGHSMGAVVALAYAVVWDDVIGLIMLAPGHYPDLPGFFHPDLDDCLTKAQEMVKTGRGAETRKFLDQIQGRVRQFSTKAQVYVSYFSPEGSMAPARNAAGLSTKTPVLCILGDKDPLSRITRKHVLPRLPANPLTRVVTVSGGHMDVLFEAKAEVVHWLKCLPQ